MNLGCSEVVEFAALSFGKSIASSMANILRLSTGVGFKDVENGASSLLLI